MRSGGQLALAAQVRGGGRVLAFKLGGTAEVPPGKAPLGPVPEPTFTMTSTSEEREQGMKLFHFHCSVCHGPMAVAGGSVPDLRHLPAPKHAIFDDIVRGGRLRDCIVGAGSVLEDCDLHDALIGDHVVARGLRGSASIGDHTVIDGDT